MVNSDLVNKSGEPHHHRHHYHSPINRGIYCLVIVSTVLLFGTVGIHTTEHFSWIDSFYFTSMIATGQGPAPTVSPVTSLGKIFTSVLAFVSAGMMITLLGFLFGPFLGKLWRIGVLKFEEELEHLKKHGK